MAGWLAGFDVAGLLCRPVKIFLPETPLDGLGQRDQGSGIPRRVQHVEPTYCHESYPPQAAWAAMDHGVPENLVHCKVSMSANVLCGYVTVLNSAR